MKFCFFKSNLPNIYTQIHTYLRTYVHAFKHIEVQWYIIKSTNMSACVCIYPTPVTQDQFFKRGKAGLNSIFLLLDWLPQSQEVQVRFSDWRSYVFILSTQEQSWSLGKYLFLRHASRHQWKNWCNTIFLYPFFFTKLSLVNILSEKYMICK